MPLGNREGGNVLMTREPGDLPDVRAISPAFFGEISPRPNTEVVMAARSIGTTASLTISQRMAAAMAALMLGSFLVWGVGLAHSQALHDAAHDTRHSYGFPCH
jgi:cobalt transporter subunit CbtB